MDVEYHTIKCRLNSILRYPSMTGIIQDKVDAINKIWVEAYFFINLYVMERLSNNKKVNLDYCLIERAVLYVIGNKDSIRNSEYKTCDLEKEIKKINIKINRIQNKIDHIQDKMNGKQIDDNKLQKKLDSEKDSLKDLQKLKKKFLRKVDLNEQIGILNNIHENYYLKIEDDNDLSKYNKIKSIKKPFEYISRQIMVNIINHLNLNFWKFQKKYIKGTVHDKLINLKLDRRTMTSIINCIQYHVNNQTGNLIIRSKYIKKLKKDDELFDKVLNIMKEEIAFHKKNIPSSLLENITKTNIKKNYNDALEYYYKMIKYLEGKEFKRFSLLPQLKLGYNYVKFDSRFISTIYDEWIGNLLEESKKTSIKKVKQKYNIDFNLEKTGIKLFEENYKFYYKRCFKFDDFGVKNHNPISFSTNRYSVCVLFEKPIITEPMKETESSKKFKLDDHPSFKNKNGTDKLIKKGLFDADECYASEDFLNGFHKIGIDPNNKVILYCVSESGKKIEITKKFYNEISHITKNKRKMNNAIKNKQMNELYKNMADTCYKKTINIQNYINFIKIYRKNRDKIWNFYGTIKVMRLELDSYIHKKKAIQKIVRKIVPKQGKSKQFRSHRNKNINNKKYEEIKSLPVLIAFGKGNGTTTISNLRNSGPKGPVKKLALELSKYCIVVLTDEYNTSKVCSSCNEATLEFPKLEFFQKISYKQNGRRKTNKEKKQKMKIKKSHGLCYCTNNIHFQNNTEGVHKLWWNRDYNSGRSILDVMTKKLLKKKLGIFSRKSKPKPHSSSSEEVGVESDVPDELVFQLSIELSDESINSS